MLHGGAAGDRELTGIVPQLDPAGTGQLYQIFNHDDTARIILLDEHPDSAEANRFHLPKQKKLVMPPRSGLWLWYVPPTARWYPIGGWEGVGRFDDELWLLSADVILSEPYTASVAQPVPRRPVLRVSHAAAAAELGGIEPAADAAGGQYAIITNVHISQTLTLLHDDEGCEETFRFWCAGDLDVVLPAGGSVPAWYDLAVSRWRVIGAGGARGGARRGRQERQARRRHGLPGQRRHERLGVQRHGRSGHRRGHHRVRLALER